MTITVHLIYEGKGTKSFSAAQIHDRRLLVEVARRAIQEAQRRADEMLKLDNFLGQVQREEAARMEKVLSLLIPELREKNDGGGCGKTKIS